MEFDDYRVGAVVDGTFRLERAVALGGGGAVFEATNLRTHERVALKVLRPGGDGSDERRRQRFLREARIAARLRSPHAVRIFDVVQPREGPPYLVMEFLDGETLAERQRRCGALPIPDVVDWILQAIEPLAEMHDAGIIHRDVKPSNLFVVDGERGAVIKLLDFGIVTPDPATEIDADLTMTDAELGTPLYMAPEQFLQAKYVDARADVWSLGVTMFQLLAGRMPFHGTTVAGVSLRILYDEPEPLEHVRSEVPAALAAVVMRCMAKDPAARVPDVRTLAEALEPFAGRPVLADIEATLPLPASSPDAMPTEDAETLDTSFETPPPHSVPIGLLAHRARLVRGAAIALGIVAWIWMLAAIRRDVGEAPRATAAPVVDGPAQVATPSAPQAIVELGPGDAPPPAPRVTAEARAVSPSPRVNRAPAPRPAPRRASPAPRAPSSSPPRPAASSPESIDDRIW